MYSEKVKYGGNLCEGFAKQCGLEKKGDRWGKILHVFISNDVIHVSSTSEPCSPKEEIFFTHKIWAAAVDYDDFKGKKWKTGCKDYECIEHFYGPASVPSRLV